MTTSSFDSNSSGRSKKEVASYLHWVYTSSFQLSDEIPIELLIGFGVI